jgi:hypothetical protein
MKFMNQPKKSNHFKLNNLLMFPLDDGMIKKNNWTILLFLKTKQKRTLVVMVNETKNRLFFLY